jgi:PAS domain S-box-containing protein
MSTGHDPSVRPESLARLLDGVGVIVCGLDAAGRILHVNRCCEQLTGMSRQLTLGRPWLEIFARHGAHDRVLAIWEQAIAGAPAPPFESLCLNRRRIRWRFSPWQHADEQEGLCAFGIDVTDDREMLAQAREAERTVAVANLSAGLAHEIRNPLNSAKLQLDLASLHIGAARSSRAAEDVQRARDEILRANDLLTDFLAFASPPRFKLARVDLRTTADTAQRRACAGRPPGVEVAIDPGPAPIIDADEELVGVAIEHLVTNAIDAAATRAPKGRVSLRLRVDDNAACVEVGDNGPGLPAPDAPVFDAFFTTKPRSTGLGLAIVRRVAFDHGGAVFHYRRADETIFELCLPVVFGASIRREPHATEGADA